MKYDHINEYIEALEKHLKEISVGNEKLLYDLWNDVALELLAARFDPNKTAIKGGFGVRTLVNPSPYTQDMDILIGATELKGLIKWN